MVSTNFGERLKSLREDNDEKQKDIAKILYLSANMISAYELGKHFPKNENSLIALAKHFNVSLDYLLGYSDIPHYDIADDCADIIAACDGLSDDNKKAVIDYIDYLKQKQQ